MPADIPSAEYILTQGHERESVCKVLYRDGLPTHWTPAVAAETSTDQTPAERLMHENFWHPISTLLHAALHPDAKIDASNFSALTANVQRLRQDHEKLLAALSTGPEPADEPTMIHEAQLSASYSTLEVLRALPRLATELKERVTQSKTPHELKAQMPKDWTAQLEAETKRAFSAVGAVAERRIAVLQTKGAAAMTAQVRWGATGAALRALISDGDVEHYAREYVDSAVEAWRGVLLVKLK
jgi:N-terminal acetyltransferase B complex non-catalytic subunit